MGTTKYKWYVRPGSGNEDPPEWDETWKNVQMILWTTHSRDETWKNVRMILWAIHSRPFHYISRFRDHKTLLLFKRVSKKKNRSGHWYIYDIYNILYTDMENEFIFFRYRLDIGNISALTELNVSLIHYFTHWGQDKFAAVFQTTFAKQFSWMKMYECWLIFHLNLFQRVQLTLFQHWFR